MVIADERYMHDSIVMPDKQVVAGYAPIMPSFAGQIGEDDILKLIAYIKSLAPERPNERRTSNASRCPRRDRGVLSDGRLHASAAGF